MKAFSRLRLLGMLMLVSLCVTHDAGSWILPYSNPGYYYVGDWDKELSATWEGFKKRYIDAYMGYDGYGLVYDPSSGGDKEAIDGDDSALSEGIGYGLLMAVLMDDQSCFDLIFGKAEECMFNGILYHWKCDTQGRVTGTGSATDADQDICLALIFADMLARRGYWGEHTSPRTGETYGEKAQTLIKNMFEYDVRDGKYLKGGSDWGDADIMNPSYFAPAWYRVFDAYGRGNYNWSAVIEQCYDTLEAVHPGGTDGYHFLSVFSVPLW